MVSALLGSVLQTAFKARSMQIKAKLSNIEFSFMGFLKDDWLVISANQITIFLALVMLDEIVKVDSKAMDYIKGIFAFVGYFGSDVALRIFSVANKRLNAAIDYKTTIADKSTGTEDAPTPAMKP